MVIHLGFFYWSNIHKNPDLVRYKTIIILYKAKNHPLKGCVQAFVEQTASIYICMVPDNATFFRLKNTTLRLLSLIVKGIKMWKGLTTEMS